jgi:hypothetical protein
MLVPPSKLAEIGGKLRGVECMLPCAEEPPLSEPPRQRVDNVDSTRSSSQQLDERPENASIENEGLVVTVMDTAHQKESEGRRFGYPRLSNFS